MKAGYRWGVVGLAVVVAAVVVLWIWTRSVEEAPAPGAPPPAPSPAPPPALAATPVEPAAPGAIPQGEDAPPPASAAAAMAQTRDAYLKFARYPPWSRPAEPQYEELYGFNQAPVTVEQAIATVDHRELRASVTLERGFVDAAHPARITAACWLADDAAHGRSEISATAEVQLAVDQPAAPPSATASPFMLGWQPAGRIALTASGSLERGGVLDLARLPGLAAHHRAARLVVYFARPGDEPRPIALPFSYTVAPPFQVVGVAGDAIVHGSLDVALDVDVRVLAPIRIRAALARPGGHAAPIAIYDRPFRPQRLGRQRTTITFFGKILHDAEQDGPFEVFRIHGQALVEGEPVPEVFWQDDRSFPTQAYRHDDFAADEWSDPEKTRKVQTYDRMATQLQGLPSH